MITETVKTLCALRGPSGNEEEVRDYLKDRLTPHVDEVRVDALGNLICFKKGAVSAPDRLMLCAHMDEVGLMVREICGDGTLKISPVGSIDRRVLLAKPVRVGEQAVPGVIGVRPVHLLERKEELSIPKWEELFIDIGALDREEAEEFVSPGDYATFYGECQEFGQGMLKAKAIDDRIGCAVMAELAERELPVDVTFAFTVQEEVGTRGAFGAVFSVTPELALILEGTTAADSPTTDAHRRVCAPGRGPVIPYMDGATVYDRGIFELLRDLAEENHIPWQTKKYLSGGTDAKAIQRSKAGVRVGAVSAAVRYLHAPTSVASVDDFEQIEALTWSFLQAVAQGRI